MYHMESLSTAMRSVAVIVTLLSLAQAARPSQCFTNVTELGANAQNVSLGFNNWESSRLNSWIGTILLTEKAGIRVDRIPTTEVSQWEMLESETLNVVLEVWPSRNRANRQKYVGVRGSVELAGLLDMYGQVGWYMPKYCSNLDAELDKPIWKDFENQTIAELFKLNQQTAQVPVTSWPGYSPEWLPEGHVTAINSSVVRPAGTPFNQYQFGQGSKGNILCDTPARQDAIDGYLVDNLNLGHLEPAYTGDFESFRDKVAEMYFTRTNMIIKTWKPNTFFVPESNQTWKRILLPTDSEECMDKIAAERDCDFPFDAIYKIVSQKLKQTSNRAYSLIRKFSINNDVISSMLADLHYNSTYSGYSSDDKEWMVACDWLKQNSREWELWIPRESCELGYVRNTTALDGAGECQICEAGNYSDSVDLTDCKVCAKGLFSSANGTSQCTECAAAEYSMHEGSTSCDTCPPSTTTFMLGSTSPEDCTCLPQTYQPDSIAGAQCIACPEGATCLGGLSQPFPKYGYYQISNHSFRECNPAKVCSGGSDITSVCREGHRGTMCTECIEGYFLLHKLCEPCSGNQPASGAWILGGCIMSLLACLSLTLLSQGTSWLGSAAIAVNFVQVFARFDSFDLHWPSQMDRIFDIASMFNFNIDLLQIECSGATASDYYGKYCFSLAVPLMAAFAFGVLYALAISWEWIIGKFLLRGRFADSRLVRTLALNEGAQIDRIDVYNALHGGYISFLTFAYIFISYKPMELLDCTQQPDSVYTLDADPSILCWEDTHLQLLPIGILGLILYTIGVPLVLIIQVYWHRSHLSSPEFYSRYGCLYRDFLTENQPQLEAEAAKANSQTASEDSCERPWTATEINQQHMAEDGTANAKQDEAAASRCIDGWETGTLYLWELALMARKLGFNVTLYFTRYATVNSTFAQVILIASLTIHMLMQPYINIFYDFFEACLLFILISVLFCGQVIHKNETGAITTGYQAMLALLLGSAALLVACFVVRDVVLKLKEMRATSDSSDDDTKVTSTKMVSPDEFEPKLKTGLVIKQAIEPDDKPQPGSDPIQDMPM